MARVKNTRRGAWTTDKYVILPGEIGVIPDAEWAELRKHPVVAHLLTEKEGLEEMSDEKALKAEAAALAKEAAKKKPAEPKEEK